MTYVVANLHGDHAGFQKLLQTIKFKDSDVLYVLGDSVISERKASSSSPI